MFPPDAGNAIYDTVESPKLRRCAKLFGGDQRMKWDQMLKSKLSISLSANAILRDSTKSHLNSVNGLPLNGDHSAIWPFVRFNACNIIDDEIQSKRILMILKNFALSPYSDREQFPLDCV